VPLVQRAVALATGLDREIASVGEAEQILGLDPVPLVSPASVPAQSTCTTTSRTDANE
jgi:hypothetical protein